MDQFQHHEGLNPVEAVLQNQKIEEIAQKVADVMDVDVNSRNLVQINSTAVPGEKFPQFYYDFPMPSGYVERRYIGHDDGHAFLKGNSFILFDSGIHNQTKNGIYTCLVFNGFTGKYRGIALQQDWSMKYLILPRYSTTLAGKPLFSVDTDEADFFSGQLFTLIDVETTSQNMARFKHLFNQ